MAFASVACGAFVGRVLEGGEGAGPSSPPARGGDTSGGGAARAASVAGASADAERRWVGGGRMNRLRGWIGIRARARAATRRAHRRRRREA